MLQLFTGTSIAQLIPIISSPFLTRLYSPADFGIYANYLAISAILTIIATLRFDVSIVIPKESKKAINLMQIIFLFSLLFSIFFQILSFVLIEKFNFSFNLGKFVHLISISVFIQALYNSFYYLCLRNKKFKLLANIRILSASLTLFISLTFPLFLKGPAGLIFANIISFSINTFILFRFSKIKIRLLGKDLIKKIFMEFRNFPLFDLPSAFLIQFSNRLPVLLLSNFFPIKSIGHFSLTQRMLDLPVSFVTTAISDTFKQKAAEDFNEKGNCLSVFYETRKLLIYLSIIPYLAIQFFAPTIFSFVFGNEWTIAGEYAQILAFMFLLRFIISPLTYTFYIRDKMNVNLFGQFLKFLSNLFALGVGIYLSDIKIGLILFAATNSTFFIFYYFYALKYAK